MKPLIPHRAELSAGNTVNRKYEVVKTIGEGAFGHVYKVKDNTGTEYALKLLRLWDVPSDIRQPLVERFEMEFKTGQIESEYLVRSVDFGFYSDNPYIVMEFCPGGDLCKLEGKDPGLIAKASVEVLRGLYDLHVNGKVHRDLKPENVLFKSNGIAALTDFGISGDRNKRMTERNLFGKPYQIFGTYAYMPPEQVNRARGMATVLPTTDIFSFGVMVYQLLTGKLPFGKLEDQNDLVRYQKRGQSGDWDKPALLVTSAGNLWMNLIDGCLKPDLKDRLQTVTDVMKLVPHLDNNIILSEPNSQRQVMLVKKTDASHKLRVMHGDDFGTVYNLTDMLAGGFKRLTIGRSSENNVVVSDMYSSRRHCTIETDGVNWMIRDGQWLQDEGKWICSSNGTYVNSRPVTMKGYWLADGDIITIGDETMKFE